MNDPVAEQLPWLDGLFTRPTNCALFEEESMIAVAEELCRRWPLENRLELLRALAGRFGEQTVLAVIDRIIATNCRSDWAQIGRTETDTRFERFYQKLWASLPAQGFEFTCQRNGREACFRVTRCPVADTARRFSAEKWFYHLVCLTDEPAVTGFNPQIRFRRSHTIMQGDAYCDHRYTEGSTDA